MASPKPKNQKNTNMTSVPHKKVIPKMTKNPTPCDTFVENLTSKPNAVLRAKMKLLMMKDHNGVYALMKLPTTGAVPSSNNVRDLRRGNA